MKVGLGFLGQIRALPGGNWIADTIQQAVAAITTGYHTEHTVDDHHGAITALSLSFYNAATQSYVPARLLSTLNVQTGDVANVGVAETTLKTYTLDVGKLAVTGDTIQLWCWGTAAANANAKTYRLYFGATVVATVVYSSAIATPWLMTAEITRTGAATQVAVGTVAAPLLGDTMTATAPVELLSGAVVVKMTGQSAVAANDITAKMWRVTVFPAA